jgi:hypothetical protein
MRYRPISNPAEISKDLDVFVELIGENELVRLLWKLWKGLNNKGYVTRWDDIRFSLELQLLNFMRCRDKASRQINSFPKEIHEVTDFIIGIGQSIPYLSPKAKVKLRGQIIGGLKTNGLRPLQHEFRVAGKLSNLGCDVQFIDLEDLGNYDFLAKKNGSEFEVEAKSISALSGRSISLPNAEKFFDVVRKNFDGSIDSTNIPILNIVVKDGLSAKRDKLLSLVAACSEASRTKSDQNIDDDISIQFVGEAPDASFEQLSVAAEIDWIKNGVLAYVPITSPKVIIRLRSEKPDKFADNIAATISECYKKQLSGTKPSVIWVHIDYVQTPDFHKLSSATGGVPRLDALANTVFTSPNRHQLCQLVFSGGAHFRMEGVRAWSMYDTIVYNNPNLQPENSVLFPGGKVRRQAN